MTRVGRLGSLLVTAVVAVYCGLVVHDFFAYIDHSIYLSVDDSLANASYALAQDGRYGFLASPMLIELSRLHGLFNYGPWYFALGAALIWLFGYSLTLLRSIHLGIVIGSIGLARLWFRGRDAPAFEWALYGVFVLWCFDNAQWPMVRPDSMVTLFALLYVVAAGLALSTGRRSCWFAAGLAAACGALTHLVAWSLVPMSALVWAIGARLSRRDGDSRLPIGSLTALVAGGLTGTAMFYAAFDFRLADQIRFIQGYRAVTYGALRNVANDTGYWTVLTSQLRASYGASGLFELIAACTWLAAASIMMAAVRTSGARRKAALVYLLPPLTVWTGYAVSLGWYPNLHSGYGVLNQVMAGWTLAALLAAIGRGVPATSMVRRFVLPAAVMLVVVGAGVGAVGARHAGLDSRTARSTSWVGIAEYTNQVLASVPARASAWGTVMFGIEHPDRVQLVQYFDAVKIAAGLSPPERPSLAPQFLLLGYPERRDTLDEVLDGRPSALERIAALFPDARFGVASLVFGKPYGVTRVYARHAATQSPDGTLPLVSAYDALHQQWHRRVSPVPAAFVPAAPAEIVFDDNGTEHRRLPTRTATTSAPRGLYLLRVRLGTGGEAEAGRLVAAGSGESRTEWSGALGPVADTAAYTASDSEAFLLIPHRGGSLWVSQLDATPRAEIVGVDLFAIDSNAADPAGDPQPHSQAIAAADWRAYEENGVRSRVSGATLQVEGNATRFEYQVLSPDIRVPSGARMRLQIDVAVTRGRVCVGVLDRTTRRFLVLPDSLEDEYEFETNRSGGLRVIVANCNPPLAGNSPSAFTIGSARLLSPQPFYSDRLVDAYERARPAR